MMASFWPTPQALQTMPEVAEGMNSLEKVVFSRTLNEAKWSNTRLVKTGLLEEVRRLKQGEGKGIVVMGSGSIVSRLAGAGLVDEYELVVHPVVLGKGTTLFEGAQNRFHLKLTKSRPFGNGNVVLYYEPS